MSAAAVVSQSAAAPAGPVANGHVRVRNGDVVDTRADIPVVDGAASKFAASVPADPPAAVDEVGDRRDAAAAEDVGAEFVGAGPAARLGSNREFADDGEGEFAVEIRAGCSSVVTKESMKAVVTEWPTLKAALELQNVARSMRAAIYIARAESTRVHR